MEPKRVVARERDRYERRERGIMRQIGRALVASVVYWIPLATLTVVLSGMVYLAVQQNERAFANDPQVQMATDARNALDAGADPQSLVPASQIDIAQSLAPYLVIFDANEQVRAAGATLGGAALVPPHGVFASAQASSPDVITWTPAPGVRTAIVVMAYHDGYVLAGRSLKLVEQRIDMLGFQVGVACVAALGLTYLAVLFTRLVAPRLG